MYRQYHSILLSLIDKHATPHTKHVKDKYIPEWVNKSIIAAKEVNYLHECIQGKNKTTFNRLLYMHKVHWYNRICMRAKSEFLGTKIQENYYNPQKLWRVLCAT